MPRRALTCALCTAALAAFAVVGQRIGLALSVVLLGTILTGVLAAPPGGTDRPVLGLAIVLALQPTLRDAGWVVAACTVAALVAGAGAVHPVGRWTALATTVRTPLRLRRGLRAVAGAAGPRLEGLPAGRVAVVGRGFALAVLLVAVFGALFASADPAFADAGSDLLRLGFDPGTLLGRAALAALVCGTAGALAAAADGPVSGPAPRPRLRPGRTELVIALSALVALFAAFVLVQRPILFGGDAYVRDTAGLGYGDHAREGFVQLVVVAGLTLAIVGVAARVRDRAVRGLLALLCVLTLVVLWSAQVRLGLVTDAYGLTRVRLGGQAVVAWLALVLGVVLAAGARRSVADRAPRIVLVVTLAAVVVFSLVNPDGRIAASIVERSAAGRPIDREAVHGLSADALHRLWEIPRRDGGAALWGPIERRLERPDGLAGFNVGRWTAR